MRIGTRTLWRGVAALGLSIAVTALLSPFLMDLVQILSIALGGSVTMGSWGATLVRLFLSALVLGVPTFLMGGTLPAAARAVDLQRFLARLVAGPMVARL